MNSLNRPGLLELLETATIDLEEALTALGRLRSESITVRAQALLNSNESTVTGRTRDADTATSPIDAQAAVLASQVDISRAWIHYYTEALKYVE